MHSPFVTHNNKCELGDQHVLTPLILYILKHYGMVFWGVMRCSLVAKQLSTKLHCTAVTTYQTTWSCSTYLADMVSQPRRPKSTTHYSENLKYHMFIHICTVAWTGTNLTVCTKVEQTTHFFISLTISVTELKVKNSAICTWILQQLSFHHCWQQYE